MDGHNQIFLDKNKLLSNQLFEELAFTVYQKYFEIN